MKNDGILLIGGGGHCKSVLDSIIRGNAFSKVGIIDTEDNIGNELLSTKMIGTDKDLEKFLMEGYPYAFITVGSVGDTSLRRRLFNLVESMGYVIPNIIDPSAIIGKEAILGKGIFVGKNTIINAGSVIGEGVIINSGAIIEHDCTINDFAHIAPGVVLCGDVTIKEDVHIGASSVVKQRVTVEKETIVGVGSVVVKDIPSRSIAYGNPCRVYGIND